MRLAWLGAAGFLLSLFLTYVCKLLAMRIGLVATPKADRWHRESVPLLGGVAIATVVMALSALVVRSFEARALLVGSAFMFLVGLVDDVRPLSAWRKLLAQVLLASALAAVGVQLRLTPYPPVNVLLTVFWIVGMTNAFNLLDNMDGLAAGVAAIAAGFRLGFFLMDGNVEGAALAAVFAGALGGFLVHNFPPASVFMGDAGSLLTGFLVAGLSLAGGYPYSRSTVSVLLIPVLVLLVPIFDTTLVTISRTIARRPISVGGRDHTSHRLVAIGFSERRAVGLLYAIAVVSGAVAVVSYRAGLSYGVVLIAFLVIGAGVLGVHLYQISVYPEADGRPGREGGFVARLWALLARQQQLVSFLVDLCLIPLAYYTAYLLRFEDAYSVHRPFMFRTLPVVVACQVTAFALFRVHHVVWRYTGLQDLITVVKAASVGAVASVLVVTNVFGLEGYSRAVYMLDWLLLIVFASACRVSFRVVEELLRSAVTGHRKVIIYGAGRGGVMVLRELGDNPALARSVIGFMDDDPGKQGQQIQGVPVLGGLEHLENIVRRSAIDEVLVASTKIAPDRLEQLAAACRNLDVPVVRASMRIEPAPGAGRR